MLRLPELVAFPLSINAVREDLRISHKTAAAWLQCSSGSTRSSDSHRSALRPYAP